MRSCPGLAEARKETSSAPVIFQSSEVMVCSDQTFVTMQRGCGSWSSTTSTSIFTGTISSLAGESVSGDAVSFVIMGGLSVRVSGGGTLTLAESPAALPAESVQTTTTL